MHQPIVFQNVRIFDGTKIIPNQAVIVQDALITAVGDAGTIVPKSVDISGHRTSCLIYTGIANRTG